MAVSVCIMSILTISDFYHSSTGSWVVLLSIVETHCGCGPTYTVHSVVRECEGQGLVGGGRYPCPQMFNCLEVGGGRRNLLNNFLYLTRSFCLIFGMKSTSNNDEIMTRAGCSV